MQSLTTCDDSKTNLAIQVEREASSTESLDWIRDVFTSGGPEPAIYPQLDAWMKEIAAHLRSGRISRRSLDLLWSSFGVDYLADSLQGRSFAQPRGYPGDFQTIDLIYLGKVSDDPGRARWDRYFHRQAAVNAVRNRKEYFKALVRRLERRRERPVRVLDVGSGSCRDVFEYLEANPDSHTHFTCIDQDSEAIRFAADLCRGHRERVELVMANALRFRSPNRLDLVWSAGVMDYLDDRLAKTFVERALRLLAPGGEAVIGNFSRKNPTRDYMEVAGRWYLHHRSPDELLRIAMSAGALPSEARVGTETEGVNLFLHLVRD